MSSIRPSKSDSDLYLTLWFPAYLLIYMIMEQCIPGSGWATQLPIDHSIPFCEWFLIPYGLWYPLLILLGVYLFFKDRPAFKRYMFFLASTFFISEIIWLLIPNVQHLRPARMPRDNVLTAIISILYAVDTNTNVFPSVHVVGSLGAILAVWDSNLKKRHPGMCWFVTLLSILICLSTVFIKQHSVLDVIAGGILSLLVAIWIYLPQGHLHLLKTKDD